MAASSTPADFAAIVSARAVKDKLNTSSLFDVAYDDSAVSPIDQFVENTVRLNKIWVQRDSSESVETELGILLVLGYVSAVESFMRALIRRVIICDLYSQRACEKYVLTFAAAKYQKREMLPEALLEESVFSGQKGIRDALKKFLDFNLTDSSILSLLSQYDAVCEIRHCCVHRFGKLGTKNAVELGLEGHKEFLEKPLLLRVGNLSTIADLLTVLVKSINNDLFRFLLIRTATKPHPADSNKVGLGWKWNKAQDRALFASYYMIFASTLDAPPSPAAGELYDRYRATYSNVGKRQART